MTCQEMEGRLDDWVDGALSAADAAEVETHLSSCPACRASERQLRQLLAHAAALPRSLTPPHDLWPAIGRRLERERAWSWTPSRWWSAAGLAAAVTVLAALTAVLLGQRPPSRARTVEIPTVRPETSFVATDEPLADPVLAAAERDYEQAANALLEALQRRRPALKAETLATIEGNLEVIDRALAEVRLALAKDPANPELNRMLVATHRKKVDVLRRVVKLSTAL